MQFMSENMKLKGQQIAFWGLLLTLTMAMLRGSWVASQVHSDVQVIKRECERIRDLEHRIYKLEVKVGISGVNRHKSTVAAF